MVVVSQFVPRAQVPVGMQLAGPGVKELTQPGGNPGAVTPSKFSAKTVTGVQAWPAVAVAVGVGDGVPVAVAVAVAVGVGTGTHCPKRIETVLEMSLATAKSCLPSPLKFPIAIDLG